ncbi:MAG: hypothetical protein KIT31_37730 [Deltaproteobacteria bacterium]|nr:hypothetical protein [Deltaproteobacteria bacterium]
MRWTPLFLLLAACGDDGGGGVQDSAPPIDTDNASCGDQLRYTGELVDWDDDTTFCGVNEALFQEEDNGAMDTTAPNGRFDMCISGTARTRRIDVTPPADNSPCAMAPGMYATPIIAIADRAVIRGGGFQSMRMFTTARAAALGVVLDPAKAHVFVHVAGEARAVSIGNAHGPAQANAATTWAPGDTGHDVFFPNVELGGGSTTLTAAGAGVTGAGTIPLEAGKITAATLLVQ